jgi:hypothetical protein
MQDTAIIVAGGILTHNQNQTDTLRPVEDTVGQDRVLNQEETGNGPVFIEEQPTPDKKETTIEEYRDTAKPTDWIIGVLIISATLLIFVRMFYGKFISGVNQSVYNYNLSLKLFRNSSVLSKRAFFFLNTIFYLNAGLFAYLIIDHVGYKLPVIAKPLHISMLLSFLVLVVYTVKYIVISITAFVFDKQELFREYLDSVFLTNKNIGLYIFPFVVAIPFVPDYMTRVLIYIGLGVVGVLVLMRLFRGFQLIIHKNVSFLYLILYLCVLEILPVMLVYTYLRHLNEINPIVLF